MAEEQVPVEPAKVKRSVLRRVIIGGLAGSIFLIAIFAACAWGYVLVYRNKVYPGVQISGYDLGGLTSSEVKSFIENINNRYAKEGIALVVSNAGTENNKATLSTITNDDNAVELVGFDSDILSANALAVGREPGTWWRTYLAPLIIRTEPVALSAPIKANDILLQNALKDALHQWEDSYHNAELKVTRVSTGEVKVIKEQSGRGFNYSDIADKIKSSIGKLSFAPVAVQLTSFNPGITADDIAPLVPKVRALLNDYPITFEYTVASTSVQTWVVSPADLAPMVVVEKNSYGVPLISLNKDKAERFIDTVVGPNVNIAPRDAKFTIVDNKMEEFQASKNGVQVDKDATFTSFKDAFDSLNYTDAPAALTVPITVQVVTPTIRTADIEGLGISEIIGVGTSTFKDSHSNRIKNIANAVKRLNGIIIAPGEIFSANKYAGPYTPENGFLPEQIIKGQEIKNEVGGGMCQIGTTLFRMAMNTGLPIVERHNHSLVVQYYADPVNGNPGTDATLYEPTLDLKFNNETGSYMLLLTEINYKKQMLTFTLWGKPDGRSGGYTHPKVSKWIPFPTDVQYVAQSDGTVPVGEMKCQNPFRGAVASFTYSRVTPTGEKIDQVFDSYYRPLPKICTVGVEPDTCSGKSCNITSSTLHLYVVPTSTKK